MLVFSGEKPGVPEKNPRTRLTLGWNGTQDTLGVKRSRLYTVPAPQGYRQLTTTFNLKVFSAHRCKGKRELKDNCTPLSF